MEEEEKQRQHEENEKEKSRLKHGKNLLARNYSNFRKESQVVRSYLETQWRRGVEEKEIRGIRKVL